VKRNILHVIGGGEIGGAEEHVLTLLSRLDKDQFQGHLLCLCRGPFAPLVRSQGIPTAEIPMRHKLDVLTVPAIRRLIREWQIGLVHTHGVRANLVARIAAKQEGLPVITTVHSSIRLDYTSRLQGAIAFFLDRTTSRLADRVIAISGALRDELVADGIAPTKVSVIYNGLDLERLQGSSGSVPPNSPSTSAHAEAIRQALGLTPDQPVVAAIARLHPVKGHKYLLGAAAKVLKTRPDVQFLVVGEGPLHRELEDMAAGLGISEHVKFTGYYPEIKDIYAITDILCLPSLMEGMGLVLMEAMAFGRPVVASRVGGIPEVVEDGVTGVLVPPADPDRLASALLGLLDGPQKASAMGEIGRRKVQRFSVDNMVRETENLYFELFR